MCPASLATWMVWSVRIMLMPAAPVPSNNGTSTIEIKANSMQAEPRKPLCLITMLLGRRPDARPVRDRRRLDQIGGVHALYHQRIGVRPGFPVVNSRYQGEQGIILDRDLHDVPSLVPIGVGGDIRSRAA